MVIVANIHCHSEPEHSGEESYNVLACKNYRLFGRKLPLSDKMLIVANIHCHSEPE